MKIIRGSQVYWCREVIRLENLNLEDSTMQNKNRGIIDPFTLGFLLSLAGSSLVVATNQANVIDQEKYASKTPVATQTVISEMKNKDSGK